jgi:hypothetical protein
MRYGGLPQRPGKVWTLFYSERAKGRGITAFKETITTFLEGVAVTSLGLRHALMTLIIPNFFVRMSL